MRQLEAYAEEYIERVAIKMENGVFEQLAQYQARQEVFEYAEKDGVNRDELAAAISEKVREAKNDK